MAGLGKEFSSLPSANADKHTRPRFLCDATLLASGGAKQGWANNNSRPVNDAELLDPKDKKFRLAATPRRYHSVALLLPDGTVLKAGSNGGFGGPTPEDTSKWFLSRTDSERYLPPTCGADPDRRSNTCSTSPRGHHPPR